MKIFCKLAKIIKKKNFKLLEMCSHVDPPQRAKSRHEELKERARILLEQARKEAMLKNVTSSPEVTGQCQILERETPETPDNSPTQKELSPVCILIYLMYKTNYHPSFENFRISRERKISAIFHINKCVHE